jgi:hypothetical protein
VNPFLSRELSREHIRDLREQSARAGRSSKTKPPERSDPHAAVSIRFFAERDMDAVRQIAALDEKPVPTGGMLLAEVRGELVAALPIDGGPPLADPFKPTADIVALLRLRAHQLRDADGAQRPRGLASKLRIGLLGIRAEGRST